VNHGVEFPGTYGVSQAVHIQQVDFVKVYCFASQRLHPIQGLFRTIGQIINRRNTESSLKQFETSMAADVTGTASDKNVFHEIISF
jgi:hypothetical protein